MLLQWTKNNYLPARCHFGLGGQRRVRNGPGQGPSLVPGQQLAVTGRSCACSHPAGRALPRAGGARALVLRSSALFGGTRQDVPSPSPLSSERGSPYPSPGRPHTSRGPCTAASFPAGGVPPALGPWRVRGMVSFSLGGGLPGPWWPVPGWWPDPVQPQETITASRLSHAPSECSLSPSSK